MKTSHHITCHISLKPIHGIKTEMEELSCIFANKKLFLKQIKIYMKLNSHTLCQNYFLVLLYNIKREEEELPLSCL